MIGVLGFTSSKRVTPNSMRKVCPSKTNGYGIGKSPDHVGAVDITDACRRALRRTGRCGRRRIGGAAFLVGSGLIGFLLLGQLFLRSALILALVLALLFAMRSRS